MEEKTRASGGGDAEGPKDAIENRLLLNTQTENHAQGISDELIEQIGVAVGRALGGRGEREIDELRDIERQLHFLVSALGAMDRKVSRACFALYAYLERRGRT